MRGRDAGHRCMLSSRPGAIAGPGNDSCIRVLDDFGDGMPVGAAELDTIEAFLGPMIEALLAQETGAVDSEPPHIAARMKAETAGENCREISVKEPA